MSMIKTVVLGFIVTMVLGCASQQAHERAMEELEMASQNSAQEVERLQRIVEQQRAQVVQLQEEKQDLEETIDTKENEVLQLQEQKQDLEETIDTKAQVVTQLQDEKRDLAKEKEQQLETIRGELDALYSQVAGLSDVAGSGETFVGVTGFNGTDVNDLSEMAAAFQRIRESLQGQIDHFTQLQQKNSELEQSLSQLEARLQDVERLKEELEQVRAARAVQEAKLAKVKQEVSTVSKEIDRITKALEDKFGKSLVVTQHQDRLVLTMLGQVLFQSGEAQLTPLGLDIMKQVGEVLATLPNKNIQVEGHTDSNPIYGRLQQKYPTNWELSTARATTVLRYLIEQTGMKPEDFSAVGYADTRPTAANETEEGRAQNRRVEIVLYPQRVEQGENTVARLTE